MATSADQNPTSQEFKRAVRSHAASASCSHRTGKRHGQMRYHGEGVILFQPLPSDTTEGRDLRVLRGATRAHQSIVVGRHRQPAERASSTLDSQPKPGHELSNANTPQSPSRLHASPLSGNTFSPLQHLATYHAPYVPGVLNHYIYNLTIPIPELDGSATVPHFRAVWLPVVLHDPVVFQVIVLFAATHYATIANPNQYKGLRTQLLTLKQFALLALIESVQNERAIDTPPSATDQSCDSRDALVAGAAKMASFEAIFGSKEAVSWSFVTKTLLHV